MIRLSDIEEQIMDALWDLKKAFPKEIITKIPEPIPPYNTVLSSVRKLEKLGYIGYEKYGKSHQYYPILKKSEYTRSMFKALYEGLMGGSALTLASYFSDSNEEDLKLLKAAIEKLENEGDHSK